MPETPTPQELRDRLQAEAVKVSREFLDYAGGGPPMRDRLRIVAKAWADFGHARGLAAFVATLWEPEVTP